MSDAYTYPRGCHFSGAVRVHRVHGQVLGGAPRLHLQVHAVAHDVVVMHLGGPLVARGEEGVPACAFVAVGGGGGYVGVRASEVLGCQGNTSTGETQRSVGLRYYIVPGNTMPNPSSAMALMAVATTKPWQGSH